MNANIRMQRRCYESVNSCEPQINSASIYYDPRMWLSPSMTRQPRFLLVLKGKIGRNRFWNLIGILATD